MPDGLFDSACWMSIGGANTAVTTYSNSRFKSVEHVVEVTAKRRLLCRVSHTDIHAKNSIVWTAARHRAEHHPHLLGKIQINCCWRLALRIINNEDGTTKNEEKKKHKKILEHIGQFREFVPPSAYSYKFVWTFSCAQIDSRKARKRELATFDESRRAVGMLNPMRDKN